MEEPPVKKDALRFLVGNFIRDNPTMKTSIMVQRMSEIGVNPRTFYNILKRVRNGLTMKRKPGQGRKARKLTPKLIERIKNHVQKHPHSSYRSMAMKFKYSVMTMIKILTKLGITRKVRTRAPESTEKQRERQRKLIYKLSRNEMKASHDSTDIVMDDECYFDENGANIGGNRYYLDSKEFNISNEVKFRRTKKVPKKVLLWIAISCKGHSRILLHDQYKGAITGNLYAKECLKSRLIPFLEKNYPTKDYLFWPDLASAHYSKDAQNVYVEYGVKVLPKSSNPPNVPQLRPIEDVFGILRLKVFKDGFKPKSTDELKKKIASEIRKLPKEFYHNLMNGVAMKVRKASRQGLDSMCH